MDKPINQMSKDEVLAELAWRTASQELMGGALYPAINADRIAVLRRRERDLEFTPCKTCGKAVDLAGASHCNNCWEVESRLEEYLRSAGGVAHALGLINLKVSVA